MNLKYRVTEQEYECYLQKSRERTLNKPLNRFFTTVLVAGPLAVLLYCIVHQIFAGWKLGAAVLVAIVLSTCNYFIRTKYWNHSSVVLQAIKARNGISKDFWLEHKLCVDDKGVRLVCGNYKADYHWVSFGGFEEINGMLIPIFNAVPADIIPCGIIASWGGTEAFITAFTNHAKEGLRKEQDTSPPADFLIRLDYQYNRESYLRDQRDAQRQKYTTRLIFNKALYAKLSLTGVMIYAACTTSSLTLLTVCVFLVFLLNYEHIAVFSPILLKRLNKNIRPILALRPEQAVQTYVTQKEISIRGDIHAIDLPYEQILAVRRVPHAVALYLTSQTILTVPAPPSTNQELFDKFYEIVYQSLK